MIRDIWSWPQKIFKALFKSGDGRDDLRYNNLAAHVQNKILVTSDFSGVDCPRESIERSRDAFLEKGFPWAQGQLQFMRACDHDPRAQNVLVNSSILLDNRKSCVMVKLEDRLPDFAKQWIKASSPQRGDSRAKTKQTHEEIHTYSADTA